MMAHRKLWKQQAAALILLFAILVVASGCGIRMGEGANRLRSTDDVRIYKDIVYYDGKSFDADMHILDIYVPRGAKNYPVVFFVHGGAWIGGDKAATANVGMTLAEMGIGVVNINYRLYPWVGYPSFVKDVARAFDWTVENIAEYNGDPKTIFVGGHSAGGHLSALIATDPSYLERYKLSTDQIRGVIGISGVYDVTPADFNRVFTKNKETRRQASPALQVTKNAPPFLLLYAQNEMEEVDGQAQTMASAAKQKGVPRQLAEIPNRNHGTILGRIGSSGDPATNRILSFIQQYD